MTRTPKRVLHRLFNDEVLRRGFLTPNEAGRGSPCPDLAGGGLYMFVARDGQVNGRGSGAEESRAVRSFTWLGWGGFSW